jgi:hypothetical protein
MTRDIPLPSGQFLHAGITVTLWESTNGWALEITPVGTNTNERLRPRWRARYRVSKKALPKGATVRDGALVLAEELCLALDGWLERPVIANE